MLSVPPVSAHCRSRQWTCGARRDGAAGFTRIPRRDDWLTNYIDRCPEDQSSESQSPYDLQAVVEREGLIRCDDGDVLDERLRNDLPVERVRVMRGKIE